MKSPSCFSLQELKLNNTGCGVTGGKMLAGLLLDCYNNSKAIGHPLALKLNNTGCGVTGGKMLAGL